MYKKDMKCGNIRLIRVDLGILTTDQTTDKLLITFIFIYFTFYWFIEKYFAIALLSILIIIVLLA